MIYALDPFRVLDKHGEGDMTEYPAKIVSINGDLVDVIWTNEEDGTVGEEQTPPIDVEIVM